MGPWNPGEDGAVPAKTPPWVPVRRWRARGAGPGEAGDGAGRHTVTLEWLLGLQVGLRCRERGKWVPMLEAVRPGSVSLGVFSLLVGLVLEEA